MGFSPLLGRGVGGEASSPLPREGLGVGFWEGFFVCIRWADKASVIGFCNFFRMSLVRFLFFIYLCSRYGKFDNLSD